MSGELCHEDKLNKHSIHEEVNVHVKTGLEQQTEEQIQICIPQKIGLASPNILFYSTSQLNVFAMKLYLFWNH